MTERVRWTVQGRGERSVDGSVGARHVARCVGRGCIEDNGGYGLCGVEEGVTRQIPLLDP